MKLKRQILYINWNIFTFCSHLRFFFNVRKDTKDNKTIFQVSFWEHYKHIWINLPGLYDVLYFTFSHVFLCFLIRPHVFFWFLVFSQFLSTFSNMITLAFPSNYCETQEFHSSKRSQRSFLLLTSFCLISSYLKRRQLTGKLQISTL